MKAQEIINKVYNHFVIEGNPRSFISENGKVSCQYRSPDGNKCAVGVLISDKYYRKTMENNPIDGIIERYTLPEFIKYNSGLLDDLREWHDMGTARMTHLTSRQKVRDFKRIAKRYNCTVPK